MKPTRNKLKAFGMTLVMILWNVLKAIGVISAAVAFSTFLTYALSHFRVVQLLFVGVTCAFVTSIVLGTLISLFREYWRKYYYYSD